MASTRKPEGKKRKPLKKKVPPIIFIAWFLLTIALLFFESGIFNGKNPNFRYFTVTSYLFGIFTFFFQNDILGFFFQRQDTSPNYKQSLFHRVLPFQRHRNAFLIFLLAFVEAWALVYSGWVPKKFTYDFVFGTAVVLGYWWFFRLCKKAYIENGTMQVWKLMGAFVGMWVLANLVDFSMIKLSAWNFSNETNLGSTPLPFPFEYDVNHQRIEVPYVEIFGFNGCITWFIHFCQILINELIKEPGSWKKLFDIRDIAVSVQTLGSPSKTLHFDKVRTSEDLLITNIKLAVKEYDKLALEENLVKMFEDLQRKSLNFTYEHCKDILDTLRKKRLFTQMERVCDAFLQADLTFPVVYRQMAQSLIEQGKARSAPFYLNQIDLDTVEDTFEWSEAKGLLGRIYKQCYVDLNRTDSSAEKFLLSAVSHYREVYFSDTEKYWHGINYAACLARGQRDRLRSRIFSQNWRKVTQDILKARKEKVQEDFTNPKLLWDYATCLEACLALNEKEEAKKWAERFLHLESGDVFEYSALYRQLREVWKIDRNSDIMWLLEAAIMRKSGGQVTINSDEYLDKGTMSYRPEETFNEGSRSVAWLDDGMFQANFIARVETKEGGPVGTGFLVSKKDLFEEWEDIPVFVTADHVIGNESFSSIRPENVNLNFMKSSKKIKIADTCCWRSEFLDVAVWPIAPEDSVLIPPLNGTKGFEVADILAGENGLIDLEENKSPIFIMGHPLGRQLSISSTNNLFVGATRSQIRYKSQTWPGSSGSPVLNENWQAIGIHTSASEGENTNHGTHFSAVRKTIQEDENRQLVKDTPVFPD
jgi:hypothetical protein